MKKLTEKEEFEVLALLVKLRSLTGRTLDDLFNEYNDFELVELKNIVFQREFS